MLWLQGWCWRVQGNHFLEIGKEKIGLLVHNLHHTTLESLKHRFVILKLLRHLFFQNWLEHFNELLSFCLFLLFDIV